jgi:hypothetical protein
LSGLTEIASTRLMLQRLVSYIGYPYLLVTHDQSCDDAG